MKKIDGHGLPGRRTVVVVPGVVGDPFPQGPAHNTNNDGGGCSGGCWWSLAQNANAQTPTADPDGIRTGQRVETSDGFQAVGMLDPGICWAGELLVIPSRKAMHTTPTARYCHPGRQTTPNRYSTIFSRLVYTCPTWCSWITCVCVLINLAVTSLSGICCDGSISAFI
jgi:hypothetical protein